MMMMTTKDCTNANNEACCDCITAVSLIACPNSVSTTAQPKGESGIQAAADDNDCILISIAKSGVASLLEFVFSVLFVLLPFQRASQSPFWTVLFLPMQ